jgi:hypothetical protein
MGNWWDGRNFKKRERQASKGAPFRPLKIQKAIPDTDPWLIYSEDDEIHERIVADEWLRTLVGSRPYVYLLGRRGDQGGWQWKGRYRGKAYW